MNKILITAALLAATLSAKAQGTVQKPIATSKCFVCDKPFEYRLYPQYETLIIRDTFYTINWAESEITIDGDVFEIRAVSRSENSVTVTYGHHYTTSLTLFYQGKRCIDYKFSK